MFIIIGMVMVRSKAPTPRFNSPPHHLLPAHRIQHHQNVLSQPAYIYNRHDSLMHCTFMCI